MKLLIDMQATQCKSRLRGIGRYTAALAAALARSQGDRPHPLTFAFNDRFGAAADHAIAALGEAADPAHRLLLPCLGGIAETLPGNQARRRAAERLARFAIDRQHADVFWISSLFEGYADDAVVPEMPLQTPTLATLYDLIPLHDPSSHLHHPRFNAWYQQRLDALRQCDRLVAISDWVRADAIERLGLAEQRIVTIGAGVDAVFRPPAEDPARDQALRQRYRLDAPFVLYSGGFDERKQVHRLIEAFAALPPATRDGHLLAIAGQTTPEQRATLNACARRARLPLDRLRYTGFVPDADLAWLYAHCALFVFPSLLEGFGLTPLEAMACGAPVACSHAASLPEVVGDAGVLFDPLRTQEITQCMLDLLDSPVRANALRTRGLARSAGFSWDAVAARAMVAIEAMPARRGPRNTGSSARPALLCTVTSTQAPAWLDALASHYDLSIVQSAAHAEDHPALQDALRRSERLLHVLPASELARLAPWLQAWPGLAWIIDDAQASPSHIGMDARQRRKAGYDLYGYAYFAGTAHDRPLAMPELTQWLQRQCLDLITAADTAQASGELCSTPQDHANLVHRHMEEAWNQHPLAAQVQWISEWMANPPTRLEAPLRAELSAAVACLAPPPASRRWLVDVSQIASSDLGTGVQRMVRSLLQVWLRQHPQGIRIEPIAFAQGTYRFARSYALGLLDLPATWLDEDGVDIQPGDTYIGLDWIANCMEAAAPLLEDWHRRGVAMHFVVNDLLPMTLPEAFHPHARHTFEAWLRQVCRLADHVHCISQATAHAVDAWMQRANPEFQFGRRPSIDHFPLGADIAATPRRALPNDLAAAMDARPSVLMVGTLEPRKGHAQALDAAELLWSQCIDFNLVIVGHEGWLVETLVARLRSHAQRGRRLFWLDRADDGVLETLYAQSTRLLAASHGEGHALPLIEAAQHGLPVLARDLAVFREILGEYPSYFCGNDGNALAQALAAQTWTRPGPATCTPPWPTWNESAARLAERILTASSTHGDM